MKKIALLLTMLAAIPALAQNSDNKPAARPVKNVILMIPDGTSPSLITIARWYNEYVNHGPRVLAIDALIRGLVSSICSNSPIGDSAPTSSCYSTGYESQTGFIATYPPADINDLVKVDTSRQYSPLFTILEACRLGGMATGMVFTCEFPHATPADFVAHTWSRRDYAAIAGQMVSGSPDVVFGGGIQLLTPEYKKLLASRGYDTVFGDLKKFRALGGKRAWALFAGMDMDFDMDRDTSKTPSLSEMTSKAIQLLSKNPSGFFLMVEGSKIDWAAHSNDPAGMISEYLAFDLALKTALDFAVADGNTVVMVVPDHGNSGVSLGSRKTDRTYDRTTMQGLFGPLPKCRLTAEGLGRKIRTTCKSAIQDSLKTKEIRKMVYEFWSVGDLSAEECTQIIVHAESQNPYSLTDYLGAVLNSRTGIGFTTSGHTGEDVILGVYGPSGVDLPKGLIRGRDVNRYLCQWLNTGSLDDSTRRYYSPHTEVFEGASFRITDEKGNKVLRVVSGIHQIVITANRDIVQFDGVQLRISVPAVYSEKSGRFYIPELLGTLIRNKGR